MGRGDGSGPYEATAATGDMGGGGLESAGDFDWTCADYTFDPFSLHVSPLKPGSLSDGPASMLTSESGDGGGGGATPAPAAAAPPDTNGKGIGLRTRGRKKYTTVLCQVPGCGTELINCPEAFYRRYRVCKHHASVRSLVLDGRVQRFCQQCGAFHDVSEFVGTRKSCQRKLKRQRQLRRRRKAATDSGSEGGGGGGGGASGGSVGDARPEARQGAEQPGADYDDVECLVEATLGSLEPELACMELPLSLAPALPGMPGPPGEPGADAGAGFPLLLGGAPGPQGAAAPPWQLLSLWQPPGTQPLPATGGQLLFPGYREQLQQQQQPNGAGSSRMEQPQLGGPGVGPLHDFLAESPAPGSAASGEDGAALGLGEAQAIRPLLPSDIPYQPQPQLTSLSIKVFGCLPDQLMPAVRAELDSLASRQALVLDSAIRPGCTSLTVDLLHPPAATGSGLPPRQEQGEQGSAEGGGDLQDRVAALVAGSGRLGRLLSRNGGVVQMGAQVALLQGASGARMHMAASSAVPTIEAVGPRCVRVAQPGGSSRSGGAGEAAAAPPAAEGPGQPPEAGWLVEVRGWRVAEPSFVLVRQWGRFLPVELLASGGRQEQQAWTRVRPVGLLPGCAELEVQAGSLVSAPRPLLALPSAAAVDEVRRLVAATEAAAAAGGGDSRQSRAAAAAVMDAFLREAGMVVQVTHHRAVAAASVAGGAPAPAPYPTHLLQHAAATAQRLVPVAAARRCPALTALLLGGVCADGCSAAQALAAMESAWPPGVKLLDAVERLGGPETARAFEQWATCHGLASFAPAPAATCDAELAAERGTGCSDCGGSTAAAVDKGAAPAADEEVAPPSFHGWMNQRRAQSDAYSEIMQLVSCTAALHRGLRNTGTLMGTHAFLPYLGTCLVLIVATAAWRRAAARRCSRSYARWREVPSALFRLITIAPAGVVFDETWLSEMRRAFDAPGAGLLGPASNARMFVPVLLFASNSAGDLFMALARPVRLWLHVLLQLVGLAVALARNGVICRTATLRHPDTQRLLGASYEGLRWLALLLPAGWAPRHVPLARCKCVLGVVEVLAIFFLNVAIVAAHESRAYRQWEAERARVGVAPAPPRGRGRRLARAWRGAERRLYLTLGRVLDGMGWAAWWAALAAVAAASFQVLAAVV